MKDGKKQISERRLARLIEAFAADRLSGDYECSGRAYETFQSNIDEIDAAALCGDAPEGLRRVAVV